MKNKKKIPFLRQTVMLSIIIIVLMAFVAFPEHMRIPTTLASDDVEGTISGTYTLSLPMPGGTKESTLVLVRHENEITGTMSAPGDTSSAYSIYGGTYNKGKFKLSADIGRITYLLEGSHLGQTLTFTMTTTETIPLDAGSRINGNTGEINGKYLVPVYSPGGIMENHFELVAENGTITGQMYRLDDGSGGMPGPMNRGQGMPEAPPGGMNREGGAPPQGMEMNASTDGKRDINLFYDGSYKGNRIELFTKTAQGSLFHFKGTVEGDSIKLTLTVTDIRTGLEAERIH
jgi:hypothetical protein